MHKKRETVMDRQTDRKTKTAGQTETDRQTDTPTVSQACTCYVDDAILACGWTLAVTATPALLLADSRSCLWDGSDGTGAGSVVVGRGLVAAVQAKLSLSGRGEVPVF